MFSFLTLRRFARSAFILLIMLCLSSAIFIGCKDEPDPDPTPDPINNGDNPPVFSVPGDLKGTWISPYSEVFIISDTTFTSKYGADVTYAGTIVNHREAGSGAGYITIQYTTATYYPDGVGKFYVIYYKELTPTTVRISGALNNDDPDFSYTATTGGKTTRTEAEAACTVEGGYFDADSLCTKMGGISFIHPLSGEWQGTATSGGTICLFTITAESISYSTGGAYGAFNFTGNIVKVINTDAAKGYMVFQIIAGTSVSDARLNKYGIVKWESYNESAGTVTLRMLVSSAAWGGLPASKVYDTIEEAETTFDGDSNNRTLAFTLQP